MIQVNITDVIALVLLGGLLVIGGVILGGILVFKTKFHESERGSSLFFDKTPEADAGVVPGEFDGGDDDEIELGTDAESYLKRHTARFLDQTGGGRSVERVGDEE